MVGGYTSFTAQHIDGYSGYYNPMTNVYCHLPDLDQPNYPGSIKYGHTVTGEFVIGGYPQDYSLTSYKFNLDTGKWDSIQGKAGSVQPYGHSAWKIKDGILIMGGYGLTSPTSSITYKETYLFRSDGSMEKKFDLKYRSFFSCAIDDIKSGNVILTGGQDGWSSTNMLNTVVRYGENGFVEDLPSINYNRSYHGCGGYYDDGGILVSIENFLIRNFLKTLSDNYCVLWERERSDKY